MTKEIKICLPVYKIIYSIAFVLILSLIRGVVYIGEIGIAMEPAIAFLAIVFCADTYLIEIQGKRREIFTLYAMKEKVKVIIRRLSVQIVYLIGISVLGYGFFYLQKPRELDGISPVTAFGMFLVAIIGTILFWGILSMTISNLLRNIWAGIGVPILIWMALNSQEGDRLFGKWNVFSFSLRKMDEIDSWEWMWGKTLSLLPVVIMIVVIPFILKKRG